ncbi:MAG: LysR family transcriptional regulator, partial [Burkholderiales bacterium]|nr:LysR family transcriptional regulator [Burkholderiales bacterium]
ADVLSSSLLKAVTGAFPGIRLRIAMGYAGTLLRWLENGEVDAALLYGPEHSSNIQARPLIKEPLWVIGPKGTPLRRGQPVPLAKLARKPMILPSAPHGIRTLVEHACAVSNVQLNISAESNALSVQRSLVIGGHGWTILPPIAVADDLRTKQLAGAPLSDPAITRTIVLALPSNRSGGPHVRCVVDLLVECAKAAVDSGSWLEGCWLAD